MIELHNMDCLEYMKGLEDGVFDICVTSPPYNLGKTHHTGSVKHSPYRDDYPEGVYQESQAEVLDELYRVTSNEGSVFYNHKNRISGGRQISPYEWLLKTDWIIKQEIVWINGTQNFDKIRFYPHTERVYWLVKSTDTKLDNQAGLKDYILQGEWPSQGISVGNSRSFPVKMVRDIVRMFPDKNKMFDPYLGGGTSAIAAHYEGFDFVGCELDEDYFKAAKARIDNETKQGDMF